MIKPFPFYQQLDAIDCGATCLRMIAKYYGRSFTNQTLREKSFITRFRSIILKRWINPIFDGKYAKKINTNKC
jgi:ABC-type bacteriocin/lantibiotic exporter with double-glycine peptidase domain